MEISIVILAVGALIFLAHLFSALFDKTRIPDVLPLVFLGVLLGPLLVWIKPEDFGKVGGVFTNIALVIILFESGLGLDLASLRQSMMRGIWLTVVNFGLSLALLTALAHLFFGFSLESSLLLGAILGGTSSAVVIPMVQKIALGDTARTSLLLESTFSDVLCIVGTLGLLQALQSSSVHPGAMAGQILASFLLSALIGAAGGFSWSTLLNRVRQLENSTLTTPAFVFIIFGLTELLGFSGGIAALSFGIVLGNINRFDLPILRKMRSFKPIQLNPTERTLLSELVFLLKTFFFIYIGLNIQTRSLSAALAGLVLTLGLFALRILVVHLSLPKTLSCFDASIAAVLIPKGLAAAVLASIPLQRGIVEGAAIQEIVYAVILVSITFTALFTYSIEKGSLGGVYARFFSRYSGDRSSTPRTELSGR